MIEEERLVSLEKKVDELNSKINEVSGKNSRISCQIGRGRLFWGLVFIVFGGIWLGREQNWLDFNFPFMPTALVVLGLYFLLSSGFRR